MDIDLENGGGGGNGNNDAVAVLRCPDPADPHTKERQPLTWLRAAPYVAATLAGAALFAVSMVLGDRSACTAGAGGQQDKPTNTTDAECFWIVVLGVIGLVLVAMSLLMLSNAIMECEDRCCVPPLEPDP